MAGDTEEHNECNGRILRHANTVSTMARHSRIFQSAMPDIRTMILLCRLRLYELVYCTFYILILEAH